MSQQQPKLYTRTKRDEMTFGILPDFVPTDLVGNMTGDARLYPAVEVHDLMMQMDEGFVGMRRSLIDKLENVRQLILYTTAGMIDENDEARFAVYQRASGSEARLKDGFSIGFGGHVESEDLVGHYVQNGQDMMQIPQVPSSFYSTMRSGMRELEEEVMFFTKGDVEREYTAEEMLADMCQGFGFQNKLHHIVVEGGFTEEHSTGAALVTPAAILHRDGETMEGYLYTLKEGPSLGEVFAMFSGKSTIKPVAPVELGANVVPYGFVSDRDMKKPGFVGNTHLGVLAMFRVAETIDFKVLEEKYTTIGWKTKAELRELHARCEPWTQYLIEHLDAMEEILRTECKVDARPETAPEMTLDVSEAVDAVNDPVQG